MRTKRKLADVLWEAANVHLESGGPNDTYDQLLFSCDAVSAALECGNGIERARRFLARLGCPVTSMAAFSEFSHGPQRQGVRYVWLLLAAHVAEDEGITV